MSRAVPLPVICVTEARMPTSLNPQQLRWAAANGFAGQRGRLLPLPDGDELIITISAGLVENGKEEPMESLYARADQMLYQAKQSGRNCVATKAC